MKIFEKVKKNKLLSAVILAYGILFATMPDKALAAVNNSMYYVFEMLMIMPVIFILTSLAEAWVPKEVIINSFGEKSGFKGNIFAFLLGSFSAGPIYAAFPVCRMLLKKGAGIANIVIVLSTWAVIKVPMLANEAKFLGPKFMAMRWVLTTISIFIMAYFIAKAVKKEDMPQELETDGQAVSVNQDYCIGCGVCVNICPKIFYMEGKKAVARKEAIAGPIAEKVSKAAEACPGKAINYTL
ncbi:permease [Lutispora saccharofermentans]|uniref:Ferredoxin n=1 Tax=Lutispora saccharofermentans TaxID=3024236 RepID=A0ABT1NKA5_9FIRM|nr:permease [Lutispora saccharofermentans]MCQ1531702.1 permease [Lutispora saccharofermentans]